MNNQIQKGYASTTHGQIHFRRVDGPGTPVVLLHRTPVSSSGYAPMLGYFAGRQAAIALDTPGFGQSFQPDGSPDTVDYANWFLEALDNLGISQFHLAAHHTGTHFAAEMARLQPERVLSLTLSGVLYAPAAERAKRRAGIGLAPDIADDGSHVTKTWTLMKSLFLDYDAELVQAETMGALASPQGRNQAFDAIYNQDLDQVIPHIKCPILIAQAADDPLTLSGFLDNFRKTYPDIPVKTLGPAFLAAPERQAGQFGRAILDFIQASSHPTLLKDTPMQDRYFEVVRREGGFDLVQGTRDVPQPGPGEVLVKVRAVSINRRDVSIRDLSYPVQADRFVPLSDAAGEIVAIGEGVTKWQVGDKVISTFFQNWADGRVTLPGVVSSLGGGSAGVLADHAVLAENGLVKMPEGWTFAEAATLPCAATTAWNALMTLGQLQAGDTVLIIGTGGVALFAVQIAAAAGAKPIILSSSHEKIEAAKALGAVDGISYVEHPEWTAKVRELTHGAGVNHVVELGGAGTIGKSVASLGLNGHMAIIGALDGFGGEIPALPMIFGALRASAVLVGSQADTRKVAAFMAEKGLRPVISHSFKLAQIEEAYAQTGKGSFGKVVVEFD